MIMQIFSFSLAWLAQMENYHLFSLKNASAWNNLGITEV